MEKIIQKIKDGQRLTPEEQLKMFEATDAVKLLRKYCRRDVWLSTEAEIRMLERPERVELLAIYSRSHSLSLAAEFMMLKFVNCVDLLKVYLANENFLFEEAELKMFESPQKVELVVLYISKYPLCDRAELKMLELPERPGLLRLYTQTYNYKLKTRAQRKVKELGLL